MKKKQIKAKKKGRGGDKSSLKLYLIAEAKGIFLFIILLLLSSFAFYKLDAANKLYFPIMLSVCIISGFLCAVLVSSKVKARGIICGLIGSAPIAVISAISALILGEFNFGLKLISAFFLTIIAGTVGGVLTANTRR